MIHANNTIDRRLKDDQRLRASIDELERIAHTKRVTCGCSLDRGGDDACSRRGTAKRAAAFRILGVAPIHDHLGKQIPFGLDTWHLDPPNRRDLLLLVLLIYFSKNTELQRLVYRRNLIMDLRVEKSDFLQGLYLTQGCRREAQHASDPCERTDRSDGSGYSADGDGSRDRRSTIVSREGVASGIHYAQRSQAYEIVRELPSDEVVLKASPSGVEVTGGRARYRMLSIDPKDFPSIPLLHLRQRRERSSCISRAMRSAR